MLWKIKEDIANDCDEEGMMVLIIVILNINKNIKYLITS